MIEDHYIEMKAYERMVGWLAKEIEQLTNPTQQIVPLATHRKRGRPRKVQEFQRGELSNG